MYLSKVSTNGQVTIPAEIRHILDLHTGDKILFLQNENGEIIFSKASIGVFRGGHPAFIKDTDMYEKTNEE